MKILFYLWLSVLIELATWQNVITLANTTYLKEYTSDTTFQHLSFDTPLRENGKLVDYDNTNVYALARRSFTELTTYFFKTIKNSNLVSTSQELSISGYQLSGMWQYQGTLDYFIGLHVETNEVRVCNLDTSQSIWVPLYCKTVPIMAELVPQYIYADCKYIDTRNSKNVYIIGIGGSSFDQAHPGQYNYAYAKFNTFYNFTESVIESNDPEVSERLVDIKVDTIHNQIYIALDINSNTYKDVSIYEADDELTPNNPNVAIIAYDFNNAVVNWIKIIGDKNYIDYYVDLEVNGNYIIVATNSYTMSYTTKTPSKDILVYKFRYETGYTEGKLVLGSSVDDIAYEMVVHYMGTYIIAMIGDNFLPHPTTGAVWGTPNDELSFGLIWISNKFKLTDIEGYKESIMSTIPLRVFPFLSGNYTAQFTFLSPASKTQSHGALFTQFQTPRNLFMTTDWNLTCPYCNRYTKQEDCIGWNSASGLYLYDGKCSSSWPDMSYKSSGIYHCSSCDYSCKTCIGQKHDQCTTCCTNGNCGTSILDKLSDSGTWVCSSSTYESHGKCLSRCENGLYARLDGRCYEQCPRNSYPEVIWDNPLASNEFTHYEDANDTDWVDYDHVLKFSVSGKGIEVPGPKGLSSMPKEFTLSFWMRAELFNTETYIINLFDRVFIRAASMKLFFRFERNSNDFIEPTYSGILNQITYNRWVYVSVSQKEHKESGIHQITQKMVIANGRTSTAVVAGSKINHTTATYSKFTNKIFIGGYSYTLPKSFTGYIKEIRLFNKFHDSPQMKVDQLKAYQVHTFDDLNLIAYWKLSENFNSSDIVQEIKDYSVYSLEEPLSIKFSPQTNPEYPTFVYNTTLGLKLCFYHDVANWKTVKNLPQTISQPWRIANSDNFPLESWTHSIIAKDQILFKIGDCATGTTMAKMTMKEVGVWKPDTSLHPKDLDDGVYYSAWYLTKIKNYLIDLGQIYIPKSSTVVSPSNIATFIIVGLEIQVDVSGGDEAYGDIIRFSEDCNSPKNTDYYITRSTNYIYSLVTTKNFNLSRKYKMCLMKTFMQGTDFYFDSMGTHTWVATGVPELNTNNPTIFYLNDGVLEFEFDTPLINGDFIVFAWKTATDFDCETSKFLSPEYEVKYGHLPMIWLGNDEGIHGVTNKHEEIHMCWKSNAIGGDSSYSRVTYTGGYSYKFVVFEYDHIDRTPLPELKSIWPTYGSTEIYGLDAIIQFNFEAETVTPAKRGGTDGKIGIYRGAVTYDGDIVMITTSPLVEITTLDEADGLTNGPLSWNSSGNWEIELSAANSNQMVAGELYFLALFPDSFSNNVGSDYYLFGNMTNGGNSLYNSLFISRSFNIPDNTTRTISGNTLTIEGVDLYEIVNIKRKESSGAIVNDSFVTESIKINLRMTSTSCSSNLLYFASIDMKDVNGTHISINNLDLKDWDNGQLEADFELTRGIKVGLDSWSYLVTEYQNDVILGQIGCDSACIKCNGPTSNDCNLWASYNLKFIIYGTCYDSCPISTPYWREYSIVYNSFEYTGKEWLKSCGQGYFVDIATNKCEVCNLDCQTCVDDKMNACITCSPIKYYYNGMCTESCPSPGYLPENTDYQCILQPTTSTLQIQIIKPPYLHKIPKNGQFYLKAYISNPRGTITNVSWTQMSPSYSQVTDNVFTMEYNPITNEPYNSILTLKMRMTSFTYISEVTSIKYLLEVSNSEGDVMSELTEFYINSAPNVGAVTQQILTAESKPVSGSSRIRFRTSGWYDDIDDSEQELSFMFYYVYDGETYLLKDADSLEIFDINLPYISRIGDGTRVTVTAWVLAYDKYLASNRNCISLKDVLINYNSTTFSDFVSASLSADMSNTDTLFYTAASMEALVPIYYRSPAQPHICTIDFQCYNGVWQQDVGSNYCKCDHGYFGVNCQYQHDVYYGLKDVSESMFDGLYNLYSGSSSIEIFDFHIILSTLKALLKDPDLLDYTKLNQIMELFNKCSNIAPHYAIALRDFSLTLYFKTAERILGKIYFERKSLKVDNPKIKYPGLDRFQIQQGYNIIKDQLKDYGEHAHRSIVLFVEQIFYRLHTTTKTYSYLGTLGFELKVTTGFPPDFEGTNFYIKENDVYWEIPYGLFDAHQNVASYVQQIYIVAIKWLANPYILNNDQFSQLGTNTTSMSFYDNSGTKMEISNLSIPISIVFPYSKNTGYNSEFLQCQYYDEDTHSFKNDGWGSAILSDKTLPCTTCAADNSYVITDVLKCRCTHLTTIGGIYKVNSISVRNDPRVGIWVSFFALNYWRQSFGYYLWWPAISFYLVGVTVAVVFDCFTITKMKKKIIKRVIVVGELNKLHEEEKARDQVRKKKEEEKRLEIEEKDNNKKTVNGIRKFHSMKSDKKGHLSDDDKESPALENLEKDNITTLKSNKKKRKLIRKKKPAVPKEDAPFNNFLVPSLHDNFEKLSASSDNGESNIFGEEKHHPELDETGLVINNSSKIVGKKKLLRKKKPLKINTNITSETPTKEKKAKKTPIGKPSAGNPQENGNSKEGTKKGKSDDAHKSDEEGSKDSEENALDKLDDTHHKYKFPSTVDIFEHHRSLWSMIAYSNPLVNAFCVTSYLCPRHVRATMLFSNTILIWFLVAVYYNNTKDPLVVPDFERSARDLASDELLIAMVVPIFTMIFGYIFWGIFRVRDQRFHQSDAYECIIDKNRSLMKALLKEMYLRFWMAYFIMISIYGAVLWYIVNFTAKFGWKVSWQWWYSGSFAFFINYFVYDPAITWFHYTVYNCSEIMWRKLMKWRSLKIACPEILDDLYIPPLTDKVKEYLKKRDLFEMQDKNNKIDQHDNMI